jgi:hypothetical protein
VLVAKQKGENTTAAGTTPIKLLPDRVPLLSMSPPGSSLQFIPDKEEVFSITPSVEGAPPPPAPVNLSWVESTTADFSHPNATRVHVDVTSNEIKLSRLTTHGNLTLNNTRTILGGEYYYDQIELKNNSTLYVTPGQVLKIYAVSITVDATSEIITDDRGYLGGGGGEIGDGPGYGNPGYNGSGGGGASYGNVGGNGGLGGKAISGDAGTGGDLYGDNSSSLIEFGSGGGGGGYGEGSKVKPFVGDASGGNGGTGGGALLLDAEKITIAGTISADGALGKNGQNVGKGIAGGGGGGSGGAIIIRGRDVSITGTLSAQGGLGGTGGSGTTSTGDYGGGGGGGGAGGRIKVFYENASLYTPPLPPSRYSVDGGTGGTGGTGGSGDGFPGGNGSTGSFYENQTTYISLVPHYSTGSYVSRVHDTGIPQRAMAT